MIGIDVMGGWVGEGRCVVGGGGVRGCKEVEVGWGLLSV